MKPKQLLTPTNITIAAISLAFVISIIRSLLQLYERLIFYNPFSRFDVINELSVGIFYIVIAAIALILFVLRQRVGWFLVVAYLAVVCVFHISNLWGGYKFLLENSNHLIANIDHFDAWAEMPNNREGTLAEFASAHRRSLFIMIGIWTAMIAFALLPFLKGVRRVYNINTGTAVLTFCLVAISAIVFNVTLYGSFERSVRITPIDTNMQVVVQYDSRNSEIVMILFPFAFEFRNRSLLNMELSRVWVNNAVEDDEGYEFSERRHVHFWQTSHLSPHRLRYHRSDLDWSRANIRRTQYFIVQTYYRDSRWDNSIAVSQPYFQFYIDEIQRRIELSKIDYRLDYMNCSSRLTAPNVLLRVDEYRFTLTVGTMQEFVERNPDLSRTLLQGDSIFFGVGIERFYRGNERNDWRGGGITLPITYSIDEMRGRRKLIVR